MHDLTVAQLLMLRAWFNCGSIVNASCMVDSPVQRKIKLSFNSVDARPESLSVYPSYG